MPNDMASLGLENEMRLGNGQPLLNLCGKYRTSCWMCIHSIAQNIDDARDVVYAPFGNVPIFEYETGAEFAIVEIPEGHQAILVHDDARPMRKRYSTEAVVPITSEEYDYMTARYLNPNRWRP
jgi:hypothetical protein